MEKQSFRPEMVTDVLNIIRADINDAQLISDLSNVTFIETYRGTCSDNDLLQFLDKYFSEEVIFKELQDENEFYFIAFVDGFAAGYIRLKEDYTNLPYMKKYKALEVKRIYVLEEYQSKKVGAALMMQALQVAAEKKYQVLWLGVWEGNEKARNFYNKFGFVDTELKGTFNIGSTTQTDHWLIKFIEQH